MTLREVPDSLGEFEWLCLYGFCSGAVVGEFWNSEVTPLWKLDLHLSVIIDTLGIMQIRL